MVNLSTLQQIIEQYKIHFAKINQEEIYKWRAVKRFQIHWNPDAPNFKEMLLNALHGTKELMDSGSYYPKRMLTQYLSNDVNRVRGLFQQLYNETEDLAKRIQYFISGMEALQNEYTPDKKHFQDPRAVFVYLNLMYPEKYFLYKYEMFNLFAKIINYPYTINKRYSIENALQFQSLCEIVLQQITNDNDLIKLHYTRLDSTHYADSNYHLLTQDVIYAATKHFNALAIEPIPFRIVEVTDQVINPKPHSYQLKAREINHIENAMKQKWLGDLGEQAILIFEKERLIKAEIFDKEPEPVSKSQGDGLGYDILSYDVDKEPIYIEVKTSRALNSPFYITQPELEKSLEVTERYRLYRLYDFDPINRSGKLIVHKGSIKQFCINAVAYIVPNELGPK